MVPMFPDASRNTLWDMKRKTGYINIVKPIESDDDLF